MGVGSVELLFVCKGSAWNEEASLDGGAMTVDARAGAAATAVRAVAWDTKAARPAHSHGAVKAKIHDNCGDGLARL